MRAAFNFLSDVFLLQQIDQVFDHVFALPLRVVQ